MASLNVGFLRAWIRMMGGSICFLVICGVAAPANAQGLTRERDVQAVFLLNLTRFVRWPEGAFVAPDAALVMGVLADDPLGLVLEEAARGEMSGRRPIEVRRVRTAEEMVRCHVVYFPKARLAEAVQAFPTLRSKPVLTVSDADGFLPLGGHVQLHNRGGQMKLRLDLDNLQRVDLSASAQLLRVAEVIRGGGSRRGGALQLPARDRFADRAARARDDRGGGRLTETQAEFHSLTLVATR